MPPIPRDPSFDSTLAIIRDPYRFISRRCRELNSDLFQTRITLRKVICMSGPAAAELFYDEDRFARAGLMPSRFQNTLVGQGGVQGLDDQAHRHRKQMFMACMTHERVSHIGELSAKWWVEYARKWSMAGRVVLYHEACELLTRVACAWAGVPLHEAEVERRARQLTAMFQYAGRLGPKHWAARIARRRAERWARQIIQRYRERKLPADDANALGSIACHRELDGQLLPLDVAAVEMLNILRPIVAVAVYFTLAAVALHEYPACRPALREDPGDYARCFNQEVRRFYPFFPVVGARVRHDFEWTSYCFVEGTPVFLDLYGTNHDPRTWKEPDTFSPQRFRQWDKNPFNFIPQGGGDYVNNHRCAGELITIELLTVAADFMARRMTYEIPRQELQIDFTRAPALPPSRFRIQNVRLN